MLHGEEEDEADEYGGPEGRHTWGWPVAVLTS